MLENIKWVKYNQMNDEPTESNTITKDSLLLLHNIVWHYG